MRKLEQLPHAALEPFDTYNQKLRDNVHPQGYKNPQPAKSYNLVVIGGGTAGLVTAFGGAGLGAKVALIESHLLGGDCLNVGCVPSKALIRPARFAGELQRGAEWGLKQNQPAEFDFPQIMDRMRRLRAGISPHDSAWRCAEHGIDLFYGNGRFVDSQTIAVDGKRLHFKKAVIASGARPSVPDIEGLSAAGYLTNETVFSLTELPKRLAVLGGGPIGCELAQALARLGSEVTIIQRQPQFLEREDADAASLLAQNFKNAGINVMLNCELERVETSGALKRLMLRQTTAAGAATATLDVDAILVAAGRLPNIDGLNLDAVGVQYDRQRGIYVNDYMQTTNPQVYAAGDVCLPCKFTHTADATARLVLANALFGGRRKLSDLVIPWCTYTDPEIAHVGLYEKEAVAQGIAVDTFMTPFSSVDRAVVDGETAGFVKIHLKRRSDKILGATIVGSHAGELISEITLAMVHGIGLGSIANVIHPYPTMAEAIRKTADLYNRSRLTPSIKSLFRAWLSFCR